MIKPNFFIVGAPKCGTTAMNDYLNQHPDIFMAKKEMHYFGADLKEKQKISEQEYLEQFQNANKAKIIGEASVWYLFSRTSAIEIKQFCPAAKILIMLRNPVDVIHSLHSQHLFDGNEDIHDFITAIGLDQQRKKGLKQPRSVDFVELPPYLDSVMFYDQVKRYLDVFDPKDVLIVLYDELVSDTKETVFKTLEFLGLSKDESNEYRIINSNKKIKSFYLHRLLKNPQPPLKSLIRIALPSKKVRHALMRFLFEHNIKNEKRDQLPAEVRDLLKQNLAGNVEQLSKLIKKDLTSWLS